MIFVAIFKNVRGFVARTTQVLFRKFMRPRLPSRAKDVDEHILIDPSHERRFIEEEVLDPIPFLRGPCPGGGRDTEGEVEFLVKTFDERGLPHPGWSGDDQQQSWVAWWGHRHGSVPNTQKNRPADCGAVG